MSVYSDSHKLVAAKSWIIRNRVMPSFIVATNILFLFTFNKTVSAKFAEISNTKKYDKTLNATFIAFIALLSF
jgi:hypothetical protein